MSNQPMSTREKMEQAKQLIQQKRYDEARTILRTVDHDKAYEWLDKINQIDPPNSGASAKKGSKRLISCLVVLLIVGVVAVIGGSYALNSLGKSVSTVVFQSMNATATGTIPAVPVALEQVEQNYVINKCLGEIVTNSGMYKDFTNYLTDESKEDNFNRIGSTAKIYVGDYCNIVQAFQTAWVAYKEVREENLLPVKDKAIAWSQFIVGWESVTQMNAEQTATMNAYRAAQPTEQR